MRLLLPIMLCLVALPGLVASSALAHGPVPPAASAQCRAAIAAASSQGRLPDGMLMAIAQVESGRPEAESGQLQPWPWTINAEGVGEFFATKAQAVAAVKALQAQGVRSIDVGCLQVNLAYHPDAFRSLDAAFDPHANALYAERFLNQLYSASRDWKQAIAEYHSSTPAIGADYRHRVMALWRNPDLAGWGLGLAVAYRAFLPEQRIYGDFLPQSQVYGAFAQPASAVP